MNTELELHTWLPEPSLSFHPERLNDRDIHPLRGLLRFGPYSSGLMPDPIRVATVAPAGESQPLYDFLKQLHQRWSPTERREYLVDWPGFSSVFGVHVRAAGGTCHQELPKGLEARLQTSKAPHADLADALLRAVQVMDVQRSAFDVLFVYLPARWQFGFRGGEDEDFDLHDYLKAVTAARAIPIQVVREDKALSYGDRASVMWRVGVALYAKAGGVPWKLADTGTETAYIGISYAVRPEQSDGPRFVTCCSQVFDADGAGLEFVAYDAHEVELRRDNPFLSRTEMFRVMSRSLDLYRRRHAGRSPRRIMVHKTTEFTRDEADGCMEALHLAETVDLVQIVQDVRWRGVRLQRPSSGPKGEPHPFPVERGTCLQMGQRELLLWTHGDTKGVAKRGSFFKGARSTPVPLRLVRHAGHGTWDDTATAVLGLSKMNWNNDSLYDILPVTLAYAKVLARVVKRMPGLGARAYQFRFFM